MPQESLRSRWVVDLACEDDTPRRVLDDEDQEGSVEPHVDGETHRHDFDGGGGGCFRACFIHTQHSLVRDLQGGGKGTVNALLRFKNWSHADDNLPLRL